MPKRSWLSLASVLLVACGSDASTPTPPTDASSETADTSIAPADTSDAAPTDTFETAACTLSGACFDDFIPHQKKAATCFGHFGTKCGTFDGTKTKCRWDDGAGFDVVTEDGGGSSVVYKNAAGEECFRRVSTGDLVFPGTPAVTYTSAIKVASDPAENALTIGCKDSSGSFTCKQQQCIDCGIDVRTCCL